MKKLLSFSVFSVVSFLSLSPHTVHAEGILGGLTEAIKSAAEIAKEAQSLKGPKKSDTSSSSWGSSGSSWDWGTGTGTTATTPATGTATDPFADLGSLEVAPNLQADGSKTSTGSAVEELKAKPDVPKNSIGSQVEELKAKPDTSSPAQTVDLRDPSAKKFTELPPADPTILQEKITKERAARPAASGNK